MKIGFYPRLAADGIRKNKRMYLPYLLTCIGMVMMTYIIAYLKNAEAITLLPGSTNIVMFMSMGIFIIIFFAALFLLYTNSFLIRRRKKEFGLYNILGMGKGNIGRILFWESVYTTLISLVFGLLFGIAFSKLAELGFVNIMKGQITYSLSVPAAAVWMTVIPFVGIFGLLFLNTLRQVWFSSAISLLRSENTGEKPPKAKLDRGYPRRAAPGRSLLSCCHYQGARFGGRSLFDRSIDGHSRNLSHYDRRVRAALPHPAKTQALLLQARSFCVGVLYGLPHEAQRCGTGVYLYPRHDGACDDLFYVGTVHRRRRCDPHPLPQGDKRLVPNG